jgi:hypothetical protein
MQLNILEIAQGLIDQLLEEEEKNRHRAEGVAMLFRRIQEAHAAVIQDNIEVVQDSINVEG